MSWIKNSLTYKYMVAVIIAAGIIGVISSFLMFIYQRNQSIQEMQDNLSSMSNAIKFSLEYEMASNQQEEISQIIETIGNGGDFRNIMIINKKGVIKSSSNVDDIGITIDIDEPTCQGCPQAN